MLSGGKTAAEIWENTSDCLLPVDEEELHLLTLPRTKEKLTRRGIHFNGLRYVPEDKDHFCPGDSYLIASDNEDSSRIFIVEEGSYYPCLLSRSCTRYKNLNEQEVQAAKKSDRLKRAATKQAQAEAGASTTRAIRDIVDKAVAEDRHQKTV